MARGKKSGGKDFKPGQSGNPAGRPPLPPEVREFRKLTLTELQGYIHAIKTLTRAELRERLRDPMTPTLEYWVYKMAYQGSKHGGIASFDTLMDRVVGRVADQVNLQATVVKEIAAKSEAELVAEAEALIHAVRGKKK